MKRAYLVCLCLTAAQLSAQSNPIPVGNQNAKSSPSSATQPDPKAQSPKAQTKILNQYGKLPLSFEANHGQADAQVKFLSRTPAYTLFLTGDEAVLTLPAKKAKQISHEKTLDRLRLANRTANRTRLVSGYRFSDTATPQKSDAPLGAARKPEPAAVLRMKLRQANPAARITGADALPGTSNYFIGNDPSKWRTNVPTYAKVKYEGIYSGIDLVYYGNQRQLEYDFIVSPGADPSRIAFDIRGAKRIRRDEHGELVFKVGDDEIRWHKPVVYQEKDGARQLVAARYAITDANRVGFELAKYDANRPLYIDPPIDPLIYSTYLGGSDEDYGYGIAVDNEGNAYVAGMTCSTDFPTTPDAFQTNPEGCYGAFVSKINPSGSAFVYSSYLGGSGGARAIAADNEGNAYVTGGAGAGFPVTPGAFQTTLNGLGDAFLTKINPSGSALVYSSYLGGSGGSFGSSIAVDSEGNGYVTGGAGGGFPVTPGAFQTTLNGSGDAFVTKFNPSGSTLVYSSYLGGSGGSGGSGVAVDSEGNAYVTGGAGVGFPVTPGAFQTTLKGSGNIFVTKLNPSGSGLVYSTYLGGSGADNGWGIAVDTAGSAYVTGRTSSTDFPTVHPLQGANSGGYDAFVTKFNPTGSALTYSTYLGGSRDEDEYGGGISVDTVGNAYVVGSTNSTDFPVTPDAFQPHWGGHGDAFVARLNASGSALFYSTYLGGPGLGRGKVSEGFGIAVDSASNVYLTGNTNSTNFPIMHPLQSDSGGLIDAFVTKMYTPAATTTTALSSSPNPTTYGEAVTFTAAVASWAGAPPDGEDVSFMKNKTVLGTGTLSGGSASFTTSTLKVGSNSITAVYAGDSNFTGSKSKPVKQVVEKPAP